MENEKLPVNKFLDMMKKVIDWFEENDKWIISMILSIKVTSVLIFSPIKYLEREKN